MNNNQLLLWTSLGCGILTGVVGIIALYCDVRWLLYTCSGLALFHFLYNLFKGTILDNVYPFLAVCLVVAYYATGTILDGLCFGICLYYAIAWLHSIMFLAVPFLVNAIVPLTSIIAFFLHAEHLFVATGVYCILSFIISHLRGKLPSWDMDVYIWCAAIGVMLLFQRDADLYNYVKILKDVLWGASAYYVFCVFYAFYTTYIRKRHQ